MNVYAEMLNAVLLPSAFMLDTSFFPKLMTLVVEDREVLSSSYEYKRVKKWRAKKRVSLLGVDVLAIPVFNGSHWAMCAVYPAPQRIVLCDSYPGCIRPEWVLKVRDHGASAGSDRAAAQNVRDWVRDESTEAARTGSTTALPFREEEWKLEVLPCATQGNAFDCGACVCDNKSRAE